MQFLTVATALFAGLAAAAPSSSAEKARRTTTVDLTFWAAADNTFTQWGIPVDGSLVPIGSDLSFTSISSDAPSNVACLAHGIDGSETYLYGPAKDVPIGPPQVQVDAKCYYQQ